MLTRLYTLVLVVFVALFSCLAFDILGIIICPIIFTVALFIGRFCSLARILLLLTCFIMFVALLLPAIGSSYEAVLRMQCVSNLKQIALALRIYEQNFHCFPPAYVADKNGKPMHSWRVLILPYLEENSLYDQYDFNEPWNGPHNQKLAKLRPSVYACPADREACQEDATQTSYAAVTGSKAAWDNDKPRNLDDATLRDHLSTSVLVAEIASDINWMEPREISLDALQAQGFAPGVVRVSSKHGCYSRGLLYDYESDTPYTASVATADGIVYSLMENVLSSNKLFDLLAIGGFKNDEIDSGPYPKPTFTAHLRWRSAFAMIAWFVSVGLLLHQALRRRKRLQSLANASP